MSIKYLNLSGLEDLWINIKNYILSKIPTKTSELTNDSGYLTSHQSLDNYVDLNTFQTITAIKVITGGNQGKMLFKNPNYTKGDAVESSTIISRLYFGNGTSYDTANGVLTTNINSAGNTYMELCAMNNTASNSNRASLILTYDKSATRPRMLKSWGDFIPYSDNNYTLGNTSNIWKECYSNAYYLGTTAFGDIVTHNASEFLTSHQSLSSCVKNVVTNNQTIQSTGITRGTAPSSAQTFGIAFSDNNNKYIGNIYGQYATDKSTYVGLYAYKGTTTANSDNVSVRVGYDASGNAYTYAPTPATADNSTQIATTAFVKAQGYITGSGNTTGSSGSCTGNAATASKVVATVANDNTGALVQGTMGSNDCFRIAIGGAANAGWAEIATGDDANEPIYVRQYKGSFTTLQRTATLLDGSGNTSFPGTVTATGFSGPLTGDVTGNASSATQFSAKKSVTLTGDVTGTASSKAGWSVATTLANSGVTAGDYGPSANASPSHGGTFSVPYVTVDAKGRVTAASTKTITLPADSNTDTKVTQTVTTGNSTYPVLLCATANATETGTTTSRFSAGLTVNTRYSSIYITNKYDTANTKGVRNTSSYNNGILYFRSYDDTQMGLIRCDSHKSGYQHIYMQASNYIKNGAISPEGTATTCSIAVRVRDNGSKTIYTEGSWENSLTPYANETYDLGTSSLRWMGCYCKNFYGSYVDIAGRYLENEYSTNASTCLYLKSKRDTDGKSGIYFSKYRQNRAQGALTGSDLVSLTLDVLENSVRTNNCISISFRYFENNVPTKIYVIPKASMTSYMGTADNPWTNAYITNLNLNGNAFDPASTSGNIGDVVFAGAYYKAITGTSELGLTVSGNSLYLAGFDGNTLIWDNPAAFSGTWKLLGPGKPATTEGNSSTKRTGLWKRIA